MLIAGGSGLVPLMAMLRHRAATSSRVDTPLLRSARSPEDALRREELATLAAEDGLAVHDTLTRRPRIYVCGPSAFVERAADVLVQLGHPAIRTERFGSTS